jgi:Spy/CpxP family protein refolding chaperone
LEFCLFQTTNSLESHPNEIKHNAEVGILMMLFILPPSLALSQDMPHGKWWHIPRVVKELNLTDAEIEQLDEAFYKSRLNLIQLKSNVEREQFELENLIDKKTLNEDASLEQYKKVEKARFKLGNERFRFFVNIRKIVGYERFRELMALKKLRQQKRRQHPKNRDHSVQKE